MAHWVWVVEMQGREEPCLAGRCGRHHRLAIGWKVDKAHSYLWALHCQRPCSQGKPNMSKDCQIVYRVILIYKVYTVEYLIMHMVPSIWQCIMRFMQYKM
jgi:hypothetical protein